MFRIKIGGIYKIEHISGYYYIGMSIDIFSRWSSHYNSIKIGKHSSPLFVSLFLSSRIEEWTFTILEYSSTTEFKKTASWKNNKEFETAYRRWLCLRERHHMSTHSKNFALNANKRYFS
jgi:hypothetical protein